MQNSRFLTYGSAMKRCRKCQQLRAVNMFPVDRSKPDGRWHSCKFCSRQYWRERGKCLRKSAKAATQYRPTLTGLLNLRPYHSKDRQPFASLPPELRWDAQELLSKYLDRHQRHLTPALHACLCACAASNVQRLGDNSARDVIGAWKSFDEIAQ